MGRYHYLTEADLPQLAWTEAHKENANRGGVWNDEQLRVYFGHILGVMHREFEGPYWDDDE